MKKEIDNTQEEIEILIIHHILDLPLNELTKETLLETAIKMNLTSLVQYSEILNQRMYREDAISFLSHMATIERTEEEIDNSVLLVILDSIKFRLNPEDDNFSICENGREYSDITTMLYDLEDIVFSREQVSYYLTVLEFVKIKIKYDVESANNLLKLKSKTGFFEDHLLLKTMLRSHEE